MPKYRILSEINVLDSEGSPNLCDYLNINHYEHMPFLVEVRVDGFLAPQDIRNAIDELEKALKVIQPEWDKLTPEQQQEHSTQ